MTMPSITICSEANITEMLLFCKFGTPPQPCHEKSLNIFQLNFNQTCIQFNSTQLEQLGENWMYGYMMCFFISAKARVMFAVTETHVVPVEAEIVNPLLDNVDVMISKANEKMLGYPYSDCQNQVGYRQVGCVEKCYFETMALRCGCQMPKVCPVKWLKNCEDTWLNRTLIEEECRRQRCPLECDQVRFTLETVHYSSDVQDSSLVEIKERSRALASVRFNNNTDLSDWEFRKKSLIVGFYYKKLETTFVKQQASKTGLDLIAAIGGLLSNF